MAVLEPGDLRNELLAAQHIHACLSRRLKDTPHDPEVAELYRAHNAKLRMIQGRWNALMWAHQMSKGKTDMVDTGPLTLASHIREHLKETGKFEEAEALRGDAMALEIFLRTNGRPAMVPQEIHDWTFAQMVAIAGREEFERLVFEGHAEHEARMAADRGDAVA